MRNEIVAKLFQELKQKKFQNDNTKKLESQIKKHASALDIDIEELLTAVISNAIEEAIEYIILTHAELPQIIYDLNELNRLDYFIANKNQTSNKESLDKILQPYLGLSKFIALYLSDDRSSMLHKKDCARSYSHIMKLIEPIPTYMQWIDVDPNKIIQKLLLFKKKNLIEICLVFNNRNGHNGHNSIDNDQFNKYKKPFSAIHENTRLLQEIQSVE